MQMTVDQAIQEAVTAHRSGRLAEAEQLYRAILQAQPAHPDANHNLGALLSAGGRPDLALTHFKRALDANAGNGQYWLSLIEAMARANRVPEARQLLAAGRQRGLAGEQFDRLVQQLGGVEAAALPAPLDLPLVMREAGKHAEAEAWLRAWLAEHPVDAEALSLLAQVLQLQKKDEESQAYLAQALAIAPTSPSVLRNVARLHLKHGRAAEALLSAKDAQQRGPDDEESWLVLAAALAANGNGAAGMEFVNRALAKRPRYAEAFANRATLRARAKDLAGAVADAEHAVSIKPHWAAAWALLASLRQQIGDLDGTIEALTQAAAREPQNAAHLVNLGELQRQAKHSDAAIATLERAIALAPANLNAWINYGTALQEAQRIEEAVAAYEKALQINPSSFAITNNLGALAMRESDWARAHQYFSQAVARNPQSADAYANLGSALNRLRRLNDSLGACRRAVELDPRSPEAHAALARTLVDIGQPAEGEASYRAALALDPGSSTTHTNLLFSIAYRGAAAPDRYLADARAWEATVLPQGRSVAPPGFTRVREPSKRLRVGYVSGDFRQHAISAFIEPVFRHHDKKHFEVVAYSSYPFRDDATDRLRGAVGAWRSLVGLDTAAARRRIIEDKIDVLIDLTGHTNNGRLDVFAHRAAPVQAHYLGYFASTGVSQIDYWIGDSIVLPPHEEPSFSERLWRLPRAWVCYQGSDRAPAPQWRPRDDGTIWFGSFNNLNKITPATVALWARLLHSLPQARLLLKTAELDDAMNVERIATGFEQHGIPRLRLVLNGRTAGWAAHMAQYDGIDVALDPVGGVGGGTTTCDALWMGVPVVTLIGDRMAGRMTASMLQGIGRPEWIAHTEDAYVEVAVALATDVALRRALRAEQRATMQSSQLCDSADLTRALEAAYREMFDRWCASGPAIAGASAHPNSSVAGVSAC